MARKDAVACLAAGKAGWTLVELLVAVAVSAILFAALGGVLPLAHRSIDRWEKKTEASQRLTLLSGRLEKDLLFAVPEAGRKAVVFAGSRDEISFYTGQGTKFLDGKMIPGLRRVRVRFSPADGVIDRTEEPQLASDAQTVRPLVLLDGVVEATFSFLGKEGWEREWRREGWPRAVQVKGICRDPGLEEVPFEKTFYPIAL